ncbi:sensor histidine kinase [Actinoplanes sp. NPDC049265]|uniref:sensor histidine kinase n=1 Tax=Actinoplanes sp. NPDC049265 TaxID=3363902 RepID=UPI00371E6F27
MHRSWSWSDLLLWLVMSAVLAISDDPLPLWQKGIMAVLLAPVVVASRRWPVPAAAVPLALSLATTGTLFAGALMVPQVALALLLGRHTAGARAGLIFVAALCVVAAPVGGVPAVASALTTVMLPWLVGRLVRRHDELVHDGWELAEHLEREQELSRLVERARIAGDMHDSLGHELSLLALRAAALEVEESLDDAARKAASELRESAARTTDRLHEIVDVLREDHPLTSTSIAGLIEQARASGLEIHVDGDPPTMPPASDRAAYRVVQEGLTNAAKHAPGSAIHVRLSTDETARRAVVMVRTFAPTVEPGAGFGLAGLDERVRLAGGHLTAGPATVGGFEVAATLPLDTGATPARPDAKLQLARARHRVRRSAMDVLIFPAVTAAVLLLAMVGYDALTGSPNVLDADTYAQLRVGQDRASVEARLPAYSPANDRPSATPADPTGVDECRLYRVHATARSPAYRICFTAGHLSHRDRLTIPGQ